MQTDIDTLNTRIQTIDDILALRQDTLMTQFQNMEATLANLQSSQQQLGSLAPISK
jgi:flagellar capping protein FliD